VDIDLNYVGAVDRERMLSERPRVERAVQAVCARESMTVIRQPSEHAGGKWQLRYERAAGGGGNLEVDLNYMFREPLWPVVPRDSITISGAVAHAVRVLDIHELAAGKIAALLTRHAGRDLFDVHQLLGANLLDAQKLRLGFVLYGAMNRKDWRTVSPNDVTTTPRQLKTELVPLMTSEWPGQIGDVDAWAERLVLDVRRQLHTLLRFSDRERGFLDRLLDSGEIDAALLVKDDEMAARIERHPGLRWKAENVQRYRQAEGR
jgi:hypothetical protein